MLGIGEINAVSLLETNTSSEEHYECRVALKTDRYPMEMAFRLRTMDGKELCYYDAARLKEEFGKVFTANRRVTVTCNCPRWNDFEVHCLDTYGDGWTTGFLEVEENPEFVKDSWQRFCSSWTPSRRRKEKLRTAMFEGESNCPMSEIRSADINIDRYIEDQSIGTDDQVIAITTGLQGVIQATASLVPFIPWTKRGTEAMMHGARVGLGLTGLISAGSRSVAVGLKSQEGKERVAGIVKDVMDETIDDMYKDMAKSKALLLECIEERVSGSARGLRKEMAELDFSSRLHGLVMHAQNRMAAAVEIITDETQAVSFASNAVEEGLRGCYDIRGLTELLNKHTLAQAVDEINLMQEWFTYCVEFSRLVEFLSSWGDLAPFRGRFQTDKFMAESFLNYVARMKFVATEEPTLNGYILIVRQFQWRVQNHLNTIKIKHQHALLNLTYPQRQRTDTIDENLLGTCGSTRRIVKLGAPKKFEKTCRRCVYDKTGPEQDPDNKIRYWCWEQDLEFEPCLTFGGIFFNGPTEISNVDGCERFHSYCTARTECCTTGKECYTGEREYEYEAR